MGFLVLFAVKAWQSGHCSTNVFTMLSSPSMKKWLRRRRFSLSWPGWPPACASLTAVSCSDCGSIILSYLNKTPLDV